MYLNKINLEFIVDTLYGLPLSAYLELYSISKKNSDYSRLTKRKRENRTSAFICTSAAYGREEKVS
jgi:hypothetical protein